MSTEARHEASSLVNEIDLAVPPKGLRLFALLVGFAVAGLFLASQIFATPPTAVLGSDSVEVVVLKNGGTFSGSVIEHADHLVVRMDNGGEVRLPYDQVDFRAPTVRDAYVILAERNTTREARYYLGLCDWCLKQSLLDEAAWQLELAHRSGAENRFVELRRQRLEALLTVARADAERLRQKSELEIPESDVGTSSEDVDVAMAAASDNADSIQLTAGQAPVEPRRLTPELIAEEMPETLRLAFQQQIQPRLVHGCSAARCHGPSTPTSFELERVARGKPITRHMTERNLVATLQLIDPPQPGQSPLLTIISTPHAGEPAPLFPNKEGPHGEHYRAVEAWVNDVGRFIMQHKAESQTGPQSSNELPTPTDQTRPNSDSRFPVQSIPSYQDLMQQEGAGQEPGNSPQVPNASDALDANKSTRADSDPSVRQVSFWEEESGEKSPKPLAAAGSSTTANAFQPRDPFDPEIFNRYIRGELQKRPAEVEPSDSPTQLEEDFPPPINQIEPPSREISPRSSAVRN